MNNIHKNGLTIQNKIHKSQQAPKCQQPLSKVKSKSCSSLHPGHKKHPRASTECDVTSILYGKSVGTMQSVFFYSHFRLLLIWPYKSKPRPSVRGGLEQHPRVSSNVHKWESYKGPLSAVILKWHRKVATSLSWGETKERKANLLLVSWYSSPCCSSHIHLVSAVLITIIPLQIWSKAPAGRTVIY